MSIDEPTEGDILNFQQVCESDVNTRNVKLRLLGQTTGRLNVLPADPEPESKSSPYVWRPGNKRMTRI